MSCVAREGSPVAVIFIDVVYIDVVVVLLGDIGAIFVADCAATRGNMTIRREGP